MRVMVVDGGDEVGVSRLAIDSMEGVQISRVGIGEEIRFTNLRSDSS